jgi:adenylate kinase family enzyme
MLSQHLSLPHWAIDQILWLPGWEQVAHEEFSKQHKNWIAAESWLIDGVWQWPELVARIERATHVIFFDLPVELCLSRAAERMKNENTEPNPYVREGCCYTGAEKLQRKVIEGFEKHTRNKLLDLLSCRDEPIVLTIDRNLSPAECLNISLRFIEAKGPTPNKARLARKLKGLQQACASRSTRTVIFPK